uniref:Uncharacterized protein n=1 Tax=Chenopodium quinoa TaxID=63459 RepID=A0A803N7K6_CHEQI
MFEILDDVVIYDYYELFCLWQSHPSCKNLYGVSFLHFQELQNIYGKDYATGKPSEGYVEAINHLEKVVPSQVTLDSSDGEGVGGSGTVNSPPSKKIKTEKTAKRRRKRDGDGSSNELASLQTFMKDMNVHLSTMANVMASTNDVKKIHMK